MGTEELGGGDANVHGDYWRFVVGLGVISQLTLLFRDDVRIIGSMLLSRMQGQEPFTERDRALLLRIHPLLDGGFVLAESHVSIEDRVAGVYGRALTARELQVALLVADGAATSRSPRPCTSRRPRSRRTSITSSRSSPSGRAASSRAASARRPRRGATMTSRRHRGPASSRGRAERRASRPRPIRPQRRSAGARGRPRGADVRGHQARSPSRYVMAGTSSARTTKVSRRARDAAARAELGHAATLAGAAARANTSLRSTRNAAR